MFRLGLFLLIFMLPMIAVGQDAGGAKVGLLYGYTVPDAANTQPRQLIGFTGAAKVTPTISLGGYYLISDVQANPGGRLFDYSVHGLMATYHTASGSGDTFYGVKAGLTKISTVDSSGDDVLLSPYHYGVAVGYDHLVFSRFTVGFEGSFMRYEKSEATNSNGTYQEDTFNTISFTVSFKFLL